MNLYDYKNPDASIALNLELSNNPDHTLIILSPCRSGSTALLNAFAMAGYSSFFQPIKTSIRRMMVGDRTPVKIDVKTQILVIKEALGPYFSSEIHYSPINILKSKLNLNAISLVALLREPDACLSSWESAFSKGMNSNERVDLFNDAYQVVVETYAWAKSEGIKTAAIRLEDLSNREILIAALNDINIPFQEEMMDWTKSKYYTPKTYGFQKAKEPEEFQVKGLLDKVKNGLSLSISNQDTSHNQRIAAVKRSDISVAHSNYAQFLTYCAMRP